MPVATVRCGGKTASATASQRPRRIEDYFEQIQALADLEEAAWADRPAPEEADEPAWTAEQVAETAQKVERALSAREQEITSGQADTNQGSGAQQPAAPTRR